MKKIQVFGFGCSRCHETERNVKAAAEALGLDAEVEMVSDMKAMRALGIMSLPGVALDGKVLSTGAVLSEKRATELLKAAL